LVVGRLATPANSRSRGCLAASEGEGGLSAGGYVLIAASRRRRAQRHDCDATAYLLAGAGPPSPLPVWRQSSRAAHVKGMAAVPQHRVPPGSRDGGRFAPAAHTEPDVELHDDIRAGDSAMDRFATAGPAWRAAAPPYRHDERHLRERREASSYLCGFAERDLVVVTDEQGREHPGVVLRPHRSDGEYGSPESHTVPVSLGVGRYTFDVTAHRLAVGELGIRRADGTEQTAIREQLEQARLDNVKRQRDRVRDADRRLAEIGLPPVGSRVTVNRGEGPAGEVTLHDLTQDGQRAAVIWDHLPGTSLVPVRCLNALRTVASHTRRD